MKMEQLVILILSLFLCISMDAKSTETYRWVDASGKIHFSDREPLNQNATSVNIAQIDTLKFSNIKNKYLKKIKKKKHKKSRSKSLSTCGKLKQQIAKLEMTLTKRQAAKDFDKQNKQLVALRWQKIKKC